MKALSCIKPEQSRDGESSQPSNLTSKLLIDEHPLQVLPSLATKVGLNEAIILQQVHYWINPKMNKNFFEGRYWVHNTYEQWQQQFPFWGEKTIRRAIGNLEELGVLISFVTRDFKKTKYYTINYVKLEELQRHKHANEDITSEVSNSPPSGQNDQIDLPKQADGSGQNDQIHLVNLTTFYNTETTPETSSFLSHLPERSSDGEENEGKKECLKQGQEEKEWPVDEGRKEDKEEECQSMLEVWNKTVQAHFTPGMPLSLSPLCLQKLQSIKREIFQEGLVGWQAYCLKIAENRFLMGQNERGFKVTLDWALNPINAQKILNGTIYDKRSKESGESRGLSFNSESLDASAVNKESGIPRESKRQEILASINDPLWKEWCSQLDVSPNARESITFWELEEISKARFIEVEDDRLVWVGSSDQNTLSRIESLRLKLLDIIQKSFPNVRALRTRIDKKDEVDFAITRKQVF